MRIGIIERHDPLASAAASLLRFPILFVIWGTYGYNFKVFMNLSVPGIVISVLFFATCASIMLGLKTRSSMLVLGLTILAKAAIEHGPSPLFGLGAVVALCSALPVGEYYSLDRYFRDRPVFAGFLPPRDLATETTRWAIPVAALLAIFIIGGPTYNQAMHHPTEWFRAWDMFHVVGRNFVNVQFYTEKAGQIDHIDYVSALGHKTRLAGIHRNKRAAADMRIVGPAQLESIIARMCAVVQDPVSLRVQARITTLKQGWKTLYDGSEPICANRLMGKLS